MKVETELYYGGYRASVFMRDDTPLLLRTDQPDLQRHVNAKGNQAGTPVGT